MQLACPQCDRLETETLYHMLMTCTAHERIRERMICEIGKYNVVLPNDCRKRYEILIGGNVDGDDMEDIEHILIQSGKAMHEMYRITLRNKETNEITTE